MSLGTLSLSPDFGTKTLRKLKQIGPEAAEEVFTSMGDEERAAILTAARTSKRKGGIVKSLLTLGGLVIAANRIAGSLGGLYMRSKIQR